MMNWKEITLGDTVEILSSKRIFAADYVLEGIPFYRSKEIIEKSKGENIAKPLFITLKRFEDIKNKYGAPINGDLLLSAVGERAGIPYYVDNDGDFYFKDGNLIWFRNFTNELNSEYLCYFLKSRIGQHKLESLMIGSAQKALTIVGLKTMDLTLPPLQEQKAIANVLTAFDDKIELLQQQNKTLETIAQTIFKEWFGKYQVGDELPEGWRVGKLGDFNGKIADFVANGSFASLKENVTLYNHPEYALFMRNTDLKSGFTQKTYVDKRAYEFLSKTKLFGGEIIISNVGDVGSVHFCPYFNTPMTLGNNVIMLKSEFQYYFYTLFNSHIGQHLIGAITGGSAQPKFNKTDFRNMEMVIPSLTELNKFEEVASKLYIKILKNKTQIQSIKKTRDTLLPKLMSGQVRVKNLKVA